MSARDRLAENLRCVGTSGNLEHSVTPRAPFRHISPRRTLILLDNPAGDLPRPCNVTFVNPDPEGTSRRVFWGRAVIGTI
jgi:hypothetical protein